MQPKNHIRGSANNKYEESDYQILKISPDKWIICVM